MRSRLLNRVASKNRLIALMAGSGLLIISSLGMFWWVQNRPADSNRSVTHTVHESPEASRVSTQNTAPDVKQNGTPQTTPNASPPKPRPAAIQSTQPTSTSIDRNAYVADANKTLAAYSQITELLNFGPSASDAVKADRIAQALAIDKQAFSQVTKLRSHLVWAGVTSGKYMELTEQAESGVSKISVGLTFMNYWVNDHSRTSDLSSGLGSVSQGAQLLLQFSEELKTL